MTDTDSNGAAPQEPQQLNPQVSLVAQYARDLSFENVAAMKPETAQQGRPDIKVAVNLDASPRGENRYEVMLKLTAKATHGEATAFVVELDYAGVFTVTGVPETHLRPFLLIECPRILFPFARRILADVTRDGGYPPLMLDLIDFAAIYRQELERRRVAESAEPAQA
ncbi:MAG: protein-export chaperone SecB [Rubrimonas sp.]|uniref:protein-export chaperone SecB n=1 Tax=Rubrimonas sp. TaxID=2036015 RepID=UPI002FDEF843